MLLLFVAVVYGVFWYFNREPGTITLKYGELVQMLQTSDPGVRFENLRVGRTEIRGEIVTSDPVSGGKEPGERAVERKSFTTRIIPNDPELPKLLNQRVGANYQAEEDDSLVHAIVSVITTMLLVLAVIVGGFLLFRYMAGGTSPLTFGRSRHRVYAQKDMHITFKDVAGIDEAVA